MNKTEFLLQLRKGLSGLPENDIEERITFYSEMIDDRIEDGISEENAVNEIGEVKNIVSQIIADIPLTKLVKEKITPKNRLKAWEIVLLALGCPIWLSLIIAALAVIVSLYAVLWSVIVALWAVFVALAAAGLSAVIAGFGFAVSGNALAGIAIIGTGAFCLGVCIFMFFGCKTATKGILIFTKKIAIWVKNCFMKKGDA